MAWHQLAEEAFAEDQEHHSPMPPTRMLTEPLRQQQRAAVLSPEAIPCAARWVHHLLAACALQQPAGTPTALSSRCSIDATLDKEAGKKNEIAENPPRIFSIQCSYTVV